MSDVYTDNSKVIENLQKELETERNLNAEIKARFVKCNTCTPDMKDKCPMFHENLCEGERCEELVDLMSLVEKRDIDNKLTRAREILMRLVNTVPDIYDTDITLKEWFEFQNAVNEAKHFLQE